MWLISLLLVGDVACAISLTIAYAININVCGLKYMSEKGTQFSRLMKTWWKPFFGIYFEPHTLMFSIGYRQGYNTGYIPNR